METETTRQALEFLTNVFHVSDPSEARGREIGDILVQKGEVGYVRDIGTFLQQFYIYAVEWIDSATVVGMRGKELASLDRADAPAAMKEPGQ